MRGTYDEEVFPYLLPVHRNCFQWEVKAFDVHYCVVMLQYALCSGYQSLLKLSARGSDEKLLFWTERNCTPAQFL